MHVAGRRHGEREVVQVDGSSMHAETERRSWWRARLSLRVMAGEQASSYTQIRKINFVCPKETVSSEGCSLSRVYRREGALWELVVAHHAQGLWRLTRKC